MTDIRVPTLGESVTEATVGKWFKQPGEAVAVDEPLVELETDKVTLEVPAPAAGVLGEIAVKDGETVAVGALLGQITDGAGAAKPAAAAKPAEAPKPAPTAAAAPAAKAVWRHAGRAFGAQDGGRERHRAVDRRRHRQGRPCHQGRHDGGDRARGLGADAGAERADARAVAGRRRLARGARADDAAAPDHRAAPEGRAEHRRHADDLQRGRHDRGHGLRNQYKDLFEKKHGQKLGFMGFFTRACIQALKEIPAVNAEIDGTDLVYKNYYHIGIAVGTEKGLVVPVVRDAQDKSLAEIEKTIGDFGHRARDGQLKIDEMQGGTFTITNGGVYGSLMSTPILNAPQSGILGMHKIQERPMVVGGKIEARPMMYLALSYDHRIVDGREAVTFLVRVKECLEDPARLVLDL